MTNPSAADLIVGNLDPKRLVAALSDLAVEWRIVEEYPDATAFHVTASDEQWSHLSDQGHRHHPTSYCVIAR